MENFSVTDDDRWMDEALCEARAAGTSGDVPIGAVVIHAGRVIGRGRNRREADQDPTAHAEILALREASTALGRWRLTDCALYVTVEPCAMCAGAAILARVELVAFGAPEPRTGAVVSVAQLLDEPRFNHQPRWRLGIKRPEIEGMLREFFEARR